MHQETPSVLAQNVAKHCREIFFGANWTWSSFNHVFKDISWEDATREVAGFNTIAKLTFHTHYFVQAALQVLKGNPLDAHDKFSFDVPEITSEAQWQALLQSYSETAREFADRVEQLPEERFWEPFFAEKYGSYYRNIHGIVEHSHYHLGQIAILKKMVQQS